MTFYKGRKVLVAGGTGTIGVPLVKELVGRGAYVKVVSTDDSSIARARLGNAVDFKSMDLANLENCHSAVKDCEFVFNLVGIKGSVGIGQTRVASYLVPMLRFQTNLMEASFESGVSRFLFVGSICSYPQAKLHFEDNMWSGMPKQNDRIPGIAKRVGELLGEAYQLEHGWDAVRIVRPSNVYGPFDDFNPSTAQVIPSLIHKMLTTDGSVKVWGDGSAIRDFIFSEDIAFWMCEALERSPPNFPLNLGCGSGTSIKELADIIRSVVGRAITLEWDIEAPTGDPFRLLDVDRARNTLGFYPRTDLRTGLTKTINWYKDQLFGRS